MSLNTVACVNIEEVIAQGAVEARLQPISSVRRRSVIGVEALCRGRDAGSSIIPPDVLFAQAALAGLTVELDHLCHCKAVEQFLPLLAAQPHAVLFLNVSSDTLEHTEAGIESIRQLVHGNKIAPPNIAIEIPESEITNTTLLQQTISACNAQGYLVALDDVGVRYSNLDRIFAVKPDILKVDRSLLQGIDRDTYKQDIFKAMVVLSERIGGWVIAEGIERVEEAVEVLALGGDLVQGYYFGSPSAFGAGEQSQTLERLWDAAQAFKRDVILRHHAERDVLDQRHTDARSMVDAVRNAAPEAYDGALLRILPHYPAVQSACVLDDRGVQISDTIWRTQGVKPQKALIFHPPTPGTDHSFKEYVFLLSPQDGAVYETQPYVPLPTSALCVTVATRFHTVDGATRILCIHLDAS